jgi:hypothetical protein
LPLKPTTSAMGQSLPKWAIRATSAFPPIATIERTSRHVSNVPKAEVKRHAITSTMLNDIVQSVLDEVSDYRHGAFRCIGDCRQLGNRSN